MAMVRLLKAFSAITCLLAVVSYRFSASSRRAVFSSHALLARAMESVSKSPELARESTVRWSRVSVIPKSVRVTMADAPNRSVSFSPTIKVCRAPAASLPHAVANSSADIFATRANSFRSSPVSTAVNRVEIKVDRAVEPILLSIPTLDTAAARPKISASDILARLAAAAIP